MKRALESANIWREELRAKRGESELGLRVPKQSTASLPTDQPAEVKEVSGPVLHVGLIILIPDCLCLVHQVHQVGIILFVQFNKVDTTLIHYENRDFLTYTVSYTAL